MGNRIDSVSIKGFTSIESLEDFPLGRLNVMIGANGAGKSNFVQFFRLLRAMVDEGLQKLAQKYGADSFFFLGPQYTRKISARLVFGMNVYEFDLEPGSAGLFVADERIQYTGGDFEGNLHSIGKGNQESQLKARRDDKARWSDGKGETHYVYSSVSSWVVYHFHDTSLLAPMRRPQSARDRGELRSEAENIAAFLLHLRENHSSRYAIIRDTVRLIAPFFDDFILEPESKGEVETVRLEWRQKGSTFPFQPSQLSDGTLRFICLATALQQPNLPSTVVIDEPELGLHPYAISLLANLIDAAAERTQVLVATQSPALLDYFAPENIIVVKREEGRSVFERLDPGALTEWLAEYSMAELWQKNVVQGGPVSE